MESDNFRKWVIAAHLVANQNFSDAAIRNEFLLIGIVFAIVFNLFHANAGHEKHIITNMKVIESRLQIIRLRAVWRKRESGRKEKKKIRLSCRENGKNISDNWKQSSIR